MKYGNYNNAAATEDMVDISSGYGSGSSRYSGSRSGDRKNKAMIICIAVAAAFALGVAGFFAFMFFNNNDNKSAAPKTNSAGEFVFSEKTVVSGVDISGKTMREAKELLEGNTSKFVKPIKLSVNIAGTDVVLDESKFEYTYNIDEVLSQVKADAEANKSTAGKDYTVSATVTEESVAGNVESLCEEYNKDAVNAYVSTFNPYSENRFEFKDQQSGFVIDSDDLKTKFDEAFKSDKNYCAIEASTSTTEAEVSTEFLKSNLVKLATYETYSTNTANGTENMRVSLAACNGSIIDPGEVWSFNDCTGDSNLESNGYKPASVISEGKITQGIGGGICQSSSTIYNAAIKSNMEIVERYNHKWASSYVPSGLDATIDYPNLDLKLKNVSGYQMFLECKVEGSTLSATFWGYQSPTYDEIKTENEMGESTGSYYSVYAYRIYYKDGKEVNREELPSSKYDLDSGSSFYEDDDNDSYSGDSDAASTGNQQPAAAEPSPDQGGQTETPAETAAAEPEPAVEPSPQDGGGGGETPGDGGEGV